MSHKVNNKPSMFSLISSNGTPGATTIRQANAGHRYVSRTVSRPGYYSPGLLSRPNRRSSVYLRRMTINRDEARAMKGYFSECASMSTSENGSMHENSPLGQSQTSPAPAAAPDPSKISLTGCPEETSREVTPFGRDPAQNSPLGSPSRNPHLRNPFSPSRNVENSEVNTSLRLQRLREEMAHSDLCAYVIPSEDAHQSEYTSPVDQRRAFISGFSGSAGVAVVTRDLSCMNDVPEGSCALSTDGRYFTQASHELDYNWRLLRQGVKDEPTWQEWVITDAIQQSLDTGKMAKIGFDPKLVTYGEIQSIKKLCGELVESRRASTGKKIDVEVVAVRENLVDTIWNDFEIKPEREFKPVLQLPPKYSGETTNCKINRMREKYFLKYGCNMLILNALDEICYLLNMRGDDIEYNPLFYSYLIVRENSISLYTEKPERFKKYQDYLEMTNCELKGYDDIWVDIRKASGELFENHQRILITKAASWRMVNCILAKNFVVAPNSPVQEMKEVKNMTELSGQRRSQIKDGFALIRYFSWLEKKLIKDHEFINEYEAGLQLLEYRKQLENFRGLSFETISSTGSNGAIIHYAPKKDDCAIINPNKLYLCDSGSQFLEGTTDTTRTLHFGTPTEEERVNYTLVLKGQIALAELKFPEGLTGFQIDCIARQFLWQHGLDYAHGTGHGVDSYGPVHSMGVGIGFRPYCNDNVVRAGHLISDEPGYYKPDAYGIRLENMVICQYDPEQQSTFNGKRFLRFETVTRVPYCRRLIKVSMLTENEKVWINKFHKEIWDLYHSKFSKRCWEYEWLKRETSPL